MKIQIIVTGPRQCGKTHLLNLLAEILAALPYDVSNFQANFDGGITSTPTETLCADVEPLAPIEQASLPFTEGDHAAAMVDPDTIPIDVYFIADPDGGNFYSQITRHGMGPAFRENWLDRAAEFPQGWQPPSDTTSKEG